MKHNSIYVWHPALCDNFRLQNYNIELIIYVLHPMKLFALSRFQIQIFSIQYAWMRGQIISNTYEYIVIGLMMHSE